MSSWIDDAGSRYLVKERNLEAAYNYLEEAGEFAHRIGTENGCAVLSADGWSEMWCGNMGCGYEDEAAEFMLRYCRPNSYACFRNDGELSYTLVWKGLDGAVYIETTEWENPLHNKMLKLTERSAR